MNLSRLNDRCFIYFGKKISNLNIIEVNTQKIPVVIYPSTQRRILPHVRPIYKFFKQQNKPSGQCLPPLDSYCKSNVLAQNFDILHDISNQDYDEYFKYITVHQNINRIPGSSTLTEKDELHLSLNQYQQCLQRFRRRAQDSPMPDHFSYDEAVQYLISGENSTIIAKPALSSQSKGIYLVTDAQNMPNGRYAFQKFQSDVLKLNGHRFELRVLFLITSVDPLVAWFYPSGFARVHLHKDDFSVVKNVGEPGRITDSGDPANISYAEFKRLVDEKPHLFDMNLNESVKRANVSKVIEENIVEALTRLLVQTNPQLLQRARAVDFTNKNAFQLFGADVFVTRNLSVTILEVNGNPILEPDINFDGREIGLDVYEDMLNTAGIRWGCDGGEANIISDEEFTTSLNINEVLRRIADNKPIYEEELTPFELEMLRKVKEAERRAGRFQRLQLEKYLGDFCGASYMTTLLYAMLR